MGGGWPALFVNRDQGEGSDWDRVFKASLPYVVSDSSQFIFFADKDFDYIDVLETVFVKCIVLLCSTHVLRYFNKVLTRKGYL